MVQLNAATQGLKNILDQDELSDAFEIYDELLRILWDLNQEKRMIPVLGKLQKKVAKFINQA